MNDRKSSDSNINAVLMLFAILLVLGGGWVTYRFVHVQRMKEQMKLEAEYMRHQEMMKMREIQERALEAQRILHEAEQQQNSEQTESSQATNSPDENSPDEEKGEGIGSNSE